MAQTQAYKAAQIIEKRRLAFTATGIPTTGDQNAADEIDRMYEEEFQRRLATAKVEALESAEKAFNKECLGFQAGWGSNEIDLAKLDVLGKTIDWLKERAAKYTDQLPRRINLNNTYKSLSDGAVIELDRVLYTHRIGFGDFVSSDNSRIRGNGSTMREVTLVDHNL